MIQLTP
jgi:syntaxin 16